MMERFYFPYHTFSAKYPESSVRVQFGNNWTFTAKPDAPDVRQITLKFQAMKYYPPTIDGNGVATQDITTNPEINLAALEKFYQDHRLHKKFIYPHPVYGDMVVKFQRPLEIPEGVQGGDGVVEGIEVELMEQPA